MTADPVGVTAVAPETLLVERALDFLAGGPSDAATLIAHICQLPAPPRAVAEHMAAALLGGCRGVTVDGGGRWRLAAPADAWGVPPEANDRPWDWTERDQRAAARTGRTPEPWERPPVAGPHPLLAAQTYAVVDVETTGGRPYQGDRVTEVAAVVVRDGAVCEIFETLVNPQRPIPRFITGLTNITWAMVKDAPTFAEVCDRLLAVLDGRVFVAHNATFDWKFLSAEVERVTGRRLDGDRLCTLRLARRLLPQLSRRSLDHVTLHYGIENPARHRAGGDARATAQVLVRLLADARERGVERWDDLRRLLDARTGRARRRRRPPAMPMPVQRDTTA